MELVDKNDYEVEMDAATQRQLCVDIWLSEHSFYDSILKQAHKNTAYYV